MQDIGGCRAIVVSVSNARRLYERYLSGSLKHTLLDRDDYIDKPKPSGYRALHLIYGYNSPRNEIFNGRKIEIQIRSHAQHVWATAVEMAGAFTNQALKSSQGDPEWLRFFALMGAELAIREKTTPVPGTPTKRAEIVGEIRELVRRLGVVYRLETYRKAAATLPKTNSRHFLLLLDATTMQVSATPYNTKQMELGLASQEYDELEKRIESDPNKDAVLVAVDSVKSLKKAFPNYFLDTHVFLRWVRRFVD